jgi:hypothetical protein
MSRTSRQCRHNAGTAALGRRVVRVPVDVVQAAGVEGARPTDDAMDFVAFGQQELGQACAECSRSIRAVLAGDAGDQCFFHALLELLCVIPYLALRVHTRELRWLTNDQLPRKRLARRRTPAARR